MRKLDKVQIARKDKLASKFQDLYSELDAAVQEFNAAMSAQWGKVEQAITAYNEAIQEANELKQEIVSDIDNYMGEHTERWLESEKGWEYDVWKGEFEEDFSEIIVERPEELDISNVDDHEDIMNQLPERPD